MLGKTHPSLNSFAKWRWTLISRLHQLISKLKTFVHFSSLNTTPTVLLKSLLGLTILLIISHPTHAKTLELRKSPNNQAKVVAKLESGEKLIPIFVPHKRSDWIKVADKSNGNVGWVKLKELEGQATPSALNRLPFHQKIERREGGNGKGPFVYRSFEYNGTKKMDKAQAEAIFKRMEKQQEDMLHEMDQMMASFRKNLRLFDRMGFDDDFLNSPFTAPTITVPDNAQVMEIPRKKIPANGTDLHNKRT